MDAGISDLGQEEANLVDRATGRPLYLARDSVSRPLSAPGVAAGFATMTAGFSTGTFAMIVTWYTCNIGVLLLNKYLLSVYHFKYPIFLTFLHMVACTLLSYLCSVLKLVPRQYITSSQQFAKIATLAVVFALSVVLGNISLRFIPVSFNQAIGATTPVFTAIFSALILSQRETMETYAMLVPVVFGIVVASGSEPMFVLSGFIACMSATAARAFKSVLQSLLLSSDSEKMNSMNLLLYMAPIAASVLLPPAVIMEPNAFASAGELAEEHPNFILMLGVNLVFSFLVNLTNFLVTKSTSALTLQVLGNMKGAVAVVVSVILFRNPVTVNGMIGYCITVMGVVGYGEAKKRAKRLAQKQERLDSEGR